MVAVNAKVYTKIIKLPIKKALIPFKIIPRPIKGKVSLLAIIPFFKSVYEAYIQAKIAIIVQISGIEIITSLNYLNC
jgi:hypothetical protein